MVNNTGTGAGLIVNIVRTTIHSGSADPSEGTNKKVMGQTKQIINGNNLKLLKLRKIKPSEIYGITN